MKKGLYLFIALLFPLALISQQTVIDYQASATSLDFVYFGGSINRDLTTTITNPVPRGKNTSTKIGRFVKPANSEVWAGGYNDSLKEIDPSQGDQICVKVFMDHIGNLALKLENPSSGGNWIAQQSNTKVYQWEELCFDLTASSIESPSTKASGRTFRKMVLFFDLGKRFTRNTIYYFDDLSYPSRPEFSESDPEVCRELVWSDEFSGTSLNTDKWTPQTGTGCPAICGWGNNELQYYRANNAEVADGKLKIIAKRENFGNNQYTSARIRSIKKGDWTYGRFEASIKLPKGRGIWPAFWMLPTDEEYGGWPQSGEIDIMEYLGHETNVAYGTIHYGDAWPNNKHTGEQYRLLSGGFHEDFHEFAIEWDENVIKWFIDDVLFSTKTTADIRPERWPFDKRFHFILNVAVGGNWPGNPNASTVFPQTMEVDYVRVYKGKCNSME